MVAIGEVAGEVAGELGELGCRHVRASSTDLPHAAWIARVARKRFEMWRDPGFLAWDEMREEIRHEWIRDAIRALTVVGRLLGER